MQVASLNVANDYHMVYWDGRKLYDPTNRKAYEWPNVNPVSIWLINETLH
jgi:hypothetical protein